MDVFILQTISISNSGGPTNIAYTVVNATCGALKWFSNVRNSNWVEQGHINMILMDLDSLEQQAIQDFPAGSYPLEVKDANGCLYATSGNHN